MYGTKYGALWHPRRQISSWWYNVNKRHKKTPNQTDIKPTEGPFQKESPTAYASLSECWGHHHIIISMQTLKRVLVACIQLKPEWYLTGMFFQVVISFIDTSGQELINIEYRICMLEQFMIDIKSYFLYHTSPFLNRHSHWALQFTSQEVNLQLTWKGKEAYPVTPVSNPFVKSCVLIYYHYLWFS